MKAIGTNLRLIIGLKLAFILVLGVYNSMVINSKSFMSADSNIASFKRLDEINGSITLGKREVANFVPLPKSETTKAIELATQSPVIKRVQAPIEQEVAEQESANNNSSIQEVEYVEPAITDNLELELTSAFHNGPIEGDVRGSAVVVDGMIEKIFVEMPDGAEILIQTRDRMQGNVFTYQDADSGEMVSGMLYEVKPGTYMITLSNDSNYAGARLEFTTGEGATMTPNEEDNKDIISTNQISVRRADEY